MTAEQRAKREAAERDSGTYSVPMCQWPGGCGQRADDACHVLPKGNYPEQRADVENLISLCRKHHSESENRKSRVRLLRHLAELHGYDYSMEPYSEYWKEEG